MLCSICSNSAITKNKSININQTNETPSGCNIHMYEDFFYIIIKNRFTNISIIISVQTIMSVSVKCKHSNVLVSHCTQVLYTTPSIVSLVHVNYFNYNNYLWIHNQNKYINL